MQLLLSARAYARVAERLPAVGSKLDALILGDDGDVRHAGGASAQIVAPEAVWLSRDLHGTPRLKQMLDIVLGVASVKWVQTYQAGIEAPHYAEMLARGVRVSRSDAQAPAIAEYVMAQMLSILHPIAAQAEAQRQRDWRRVPFREIGSMYIVLIGYGAIGRAVEARLAPFGARVSIVRAQQGARWRALSDLPALLPGADAVILACALNDETRGLAGDKFFEDLKPGALLINVARGGLVDEAALRTGLERQQPGFAVLDVFAEEPLSRSSWLWDHPRVRVTAHAANDGDRVTERGDALFLANLTAYCAASR